MYGATRGREVTIIAFSTRDAMIEWVEGMNGNAYVLADNDPLLAGVDLQPGQSVVKVNGVIQVPEPMFTPDPVVEEPEVPDLPVEPEPKIEPVESKPEPEPIPEYLAEPKTTTTPEPPAKKRRRRGRPRKQR